MCPGPRTGVRPPTWRRPTQDRCDAIARDRLDLGVGVTQLGQIGRARPGVQLGQQAVVARAGLGLGHRALVVVEVAEDDRPGRAGRLAGGHDLVAADGAILDLGGDPRGVDPLHAVRAFLHHPARRTVTSGLRISFRLGVVSSE